MGHHQSVNSLSREEGVGEEAHQVSYFPGGHVPTTPLNPGALTWGTNIKGKDPGTKVDFQTLSQQSLFFSDCTVDLIARDFSLAWGQGPRNEVERIVYQVAQSDSYG